MKIGTQFKFLFEKQEPDENSNPIIVKSIYDSYKSLPKELEDAISEGTLMYLKVLSLDERFEKDRKRILKSMDFPKSLQDPLNWSNLTDEEKWYYQNKCHSMGLSDQLHDNYYIPPELSSEFYNLIFARYVQIPIKKVVIAGEYDHSNSRFALESIHIFSNISKNTLIQEIDELWPDIKKSMRSMFDGKHRQVYINDRDFKLYLERVVKKRKFREIGNDPEINLTEDATKQAYRKVQKQIQTIHKR